MNQDGNPVLPVVTHMALVAKCYFLNSCGKSARRHYSDEMQDFGTDFEVQGNSGSWSWRELWSSTWSESPYSPLPESQHPLFEPDSLL